MTAPNPILPYAVTPELPRFARLLLKPVGYPFLLICLLWSLALLWNARIPSNLSTALLAFTIGLPLCIVWLLRQTLRLALLRIYKLPFKQFLHRAHLSVLALLVGLLTIITLEFELPFRAALFFSRPSLERYADQALANPASLPNTTTVALFPIYELHADPATHTVRFFIQGSGIFSANGFIIYRGPLPRPPASAFFSSDADYRCEEDLHPNWYRLRHFSL